MTSHLAENSKQCVEWGFATAVASPTGIKEKERKGGEGGSTVRKKEDISNPSREITIV